MKAIRVLVVDDQPAVRAALGILMAVHPDISVVGEAADGLSAVQAAGVLQPDVVVMDYEMPGMNGVDAAVALRAGGAGCRVVMLSLHDDPAVKAAASEAGVIALITKSVSTLLLLAAVREAAVSRPAEGDT
jgi:DNA-binding NarL/FixJ family response regulator